MLDSHLSLIYKLSDRQVQEPSHYLSACQRVFQNPCLIESQGKESIKTQYVSGKGCVSMFILANKCSFLEDYYLNEKPDGRNLS